MKYVNFRKGLVSKPQLIPLDENYNPYIYTDDINKDYYTSLFLYDDHHKKILEEKGTLAGIKDVSTDVLYFDFDSKEDINLARDDALALINRLKKNGVNEYSICFSGKKGFSVEVYCNEYFTVDEFKATVQSLAGDLKTFDTTVSDPQRIVRLPNTKHQSAPFFKVPLSEDDLFVCHIEEIQHMAAKQNFDLYNPKYVNLPRGFKKTTPIKPVVEHTEVVNDMSGFDLKARPTQFDEARWLINNGFFESGERSTALLCLASFYKSLGYHQEQTYRLLKGTAELQSQRTGDERFPDVELYNNIIMQVYSANWKGGIYSIHDKNSWLHKYAIKKGINLKREISVGKFVDIENDFLDFVKNIEQNTIKTGIREIDNEMSITTGSMLGIVGPAASGKTSLTLDILNNTSKDGVISVFASLDMYRTRIYEKLIYRITEGKMSRKQVYDLYKNGDSSNVKKKIEQEFGNVYFYDKSSPTVQDLKDYILNVEETSGQKVKLLMIDYFERVSSDMSDDTAASKRVSGELQDLMNDLNICIIILYQPNKASIGHGPDVPILNYTAIKGSGFVFQSLRNIISICRYGQHVKYQEYDKFFNINILKNDLGVLGCYDYHWDGRTGRIRQLEDNERKELDEFLKLKQLNKDNGETNNGWN